MQFTQWFTGITEKSLSCQDTAKPQPNKGIKNVASDGSGWVLDDEERKLRCNSTARANILLAAVVLAISTPVGAQNTIKRQVNKNDVYVKPPVKAGDNGHLLRVDFSVAGGNVTAVDYNCIGDVCGWVHPCDANSCSGHDVPVEFVGNGTAIWWGWSNSGDNCVLDFTIHY